MAAAARLERLKLSVQADVDALPNAVVSLALDSRDERAGGISLVPSQESPIAESKGQAASTLPPSIARDLEPTEQSSERRLVWFKSAQSSYNPKDLPVRAALESESIKLPEINLERGSLASPNHHFSPIRALEKYPYKFCDPSHKQDIASAFFDEGKFWRRKWDL